MDSPRESALSEGRKRMHRTSTLVTLPDINPHISPIIPIDPTYPPKSIQ